MTSPAFLHPEIETIAPEALAPLQERLWREQWAYIRAHSTFYRRKLGKAIDHAFTLDGLRELPLTDKEEIRAAQEAWPPYGDYVACTVDVWARGTKSGLPAARVDARSGPRIAGQLLSRGKPCDISHLEGDHHGPTPGRGSIR